MSRTAPGGGSRIQYNEPEIRTMIDILRQTAGQLRDLGDDMQSVARVVHDGALLGQAGEELYGAINSTLFGSINRLAERLDERANYVSRELDQLIAAASSASN